MLIRIATSAALFLYLLGRNTINGNTEEDKDDSQIAGAPSELQVHASYDSVQVSWSPPRDDNILIRGYQIGWGINIPDVEKAVVDSTLRQYTIHGLRPNREYVISLRAFNKIGQGFPIYETVKTFSYGKSLTEPPSAHFGDDNQMLSPPVGLLAETLSSSQIHLSWVPNEEAFNEIYTIKYGQSGTNDQFKELNTTEDEHTFDGLKSDTQYEFAVRVANSQEWSLIAVNRTFPAPPSSPPRDLTAIGPQTKKENPDTVTLTWQPPKYANGEIKEYIILYSNDLTSPEREWMMTNVQGDRLSATIHGLFSATIYHFKVQARNVKGYGPFSSVINYTTPKPIVRDFGFDHRFTIEKGEQNISLYQHIMQMFSANLTNILLGAVTVILLVLVIALVIVCSQRKISTNGNGKKTSRQGYIQGRKQSTNCPPINADDLWIQQNGGGRFAALVNNSGTAGGIVYENYDLTTTASDCGQRILLVDHQQRAFIASDSPRPHMESPIPHYQSHYDALRPHQDEHVGIGNSSNFPSQPLIQSVNCRAPPNIAKATQHRQNRNSLPPRICTSTSASPMVVKPARINNRENFMMKSLSPASYESFCPTDPKQQQGFTSLRNSTEMSKSSQNVFKKEVQSSPAKCEGHAEIESEMGNCWVKQSAAATKEDEHCCWQARPTLTVKQARRTSTADYGHLRERELMGQQQQKMPSSMAKSVNFASKLVTVAGADEEEQQIGFIDAINNNNADTKKRGERVEEDVDRNNLGGPAGTLSRNYLNSALVNPNDAHFHHQQQQSQQTPTTPRNPHIVYARADRQPIAKVDFELEHPSPLMPFHDDSGSFSEISRAGIGGFDKNNCSQLSPPLPVTNTGRNERNSCDYQKLVNQNPPATSMHSFGALDKQQQPKVAHIVRPIVASHMASNSSPSAVRNAVSQLQQQQKTPPLMGQRFTAGGKVPIGRATAQPRVNIANASESPSPYSSVRVQRGSRELDGNGTTTMHLENGGRMPENGQQRKFYQNKSNGSAEELNVQEIDQMIDTLQQLQHEFTNAEA